MANTAQSKKRARQSVQRTLNNTKQRSAIRTAVKKVLKLIVTDANAAKIEFQQTARLLDRAGSKKIISPRKADRLKSRLNKRLKAKIMASA